MNGRRDPELDALIGAYALDAVDPRERDAIEAYLDGADAARAEVDELRETAAALALAADDDATAAASDDLWQRIVTQIADEPRPAAPAEPHGADHDELALRRAERRRRLPVAWLTSGVAAAAIVAVVVLAAQVVSLQNELDDARSPGQDSIAAAYDEARDVEGVEDLALVPATATGGAQEVARVALLPDGTGYLVNEGLAPLSEDKTYQLWAVVAAGDEQRVISAGVLGPEFRAATFTVEGDVRQFVLTVEDAGGVVSSEQEAFAATT